MKCFISRTFFVSVFPDFHSFTPTNVVLYIILPLNSCLCTYVGMLPLHPSRRSTVNVGTRGSSSARLNSCLPGMRASDRRASSARYRHLSTSWVACCAVKTPWTVSIMHSPSLRAKKSCFLALLRPICDIPPVVDRTWSTIRSACRMFA